MYRSFSDFRDYPVSLSIPNWHDHILIEHPEMFGQEDAIAATLRDPDMRYRNPAYPDREIFYRRMNFKFRVGNAYVESEEFMKVVVAYEPILDFMRGTIVTAFPTSKLREGEVLEWTRNPKSKA
jgi:hypothetical protein